MKINKLLIVLGFILIFALSFLLPDYFLPADVLNNIPLFSINGWERPKNSLLADPIFQFEPWRHYAKERLLEGQFPLWNDKNGNGAPFFANPQTAVLYPLNFFYYVLSEKNALYLIPFLKLYLFGIFSYFYLKALKISKKASLIGAIAAVFSGFPIIWLLWPQTNVFILFPLVLFITEKIRNSQKSAHRLYLLLSLTYFIGILGGHPETLFLLGIIHLLCILFRFWGKPAKIFSFFLSIMFGFFLGAIQLIPFFEYLSNSFVIGSRSNQLVDYFLPIKSFVFNLFPFLLGAPHLDFYRPFANFTNFQEDIGGYVGLIVLSLAVFGAVKWRRITEFRLWIFIILFSFFISYNIWPFSFISNIPPFNVTATQRLIGFFGFGLVVLFSLTLNRLNEIKISFSKSERILEISLISLSLFFLIINIFFSKVSFFSLKVLNFSKFLSWHIFFILVTTIAFYLLLIFFLKKKKNGFLLLLIPIFLQTIVLFWNYNPLVEKNNYYPRTKLTEKIKSLPKGNIIEVGNPSIPANINLIYGIYHSQNNDAIEIANYRNSFDTSFPGKNYWGNIDKVSKQKLKDLGIKYIISDYDINLITQKMHEAKNVLNQITKSNSLGVNFKPAYENFKGIRIFTANYNRNNNCILNFQLIERKSGRKISDKNVKCSQIRNYMFYTILFDSILNKDNDYTLKIQTNGNLENSIALVGNGKNQPYLEFLYETSNKPNEYKLLLEENNIYLFEAENIKEIEGINSYSIISNTPEEIVIDGHTNRDSLLLIQKTFYPGWTARIDGVNTNIKEKNSLISVYIPKGNHVIELSYKPQSFYIGCILSFFSFLIAFIYLFRNERHEKYWIKFNTKWETLAKIAGIIKWWNHLIIFLAGIILSLIVSFIIVKLIPINFILPKTSAINWYTTHNYPRQQDYFYFFVILFITTTFSFFIWLFYLWIKRKNI